MGNNLDCCKDTSNIDNELESEVILTRERTTSYSINSSRRAKQPVTTPSKVV